MTPAGVGMDSQRRFEALLRLADELGVEVRAEPLGGQGGNLCVLRGHSILFLDTQADAADRLDQTAAALAGLPGLDDIYLRPDVRDLLDQYRGGR